MGNDNYNFLYRRTSTSVVEYSGGLIEQQHPNQMKKITNWCWQVFPGESAPKKTKVGLSAHKAIVTMFWDVYNILLIDFIFKSKEKSTTNIMPTYRNG